MTNQQFIDVISKHVIKYAPKYNIKVCSPIIAQAILESGYGTSELAKNANNFFGLKYRKDRCPTASGIYHKVGSEQNPDGTYVSSAMKWCKFDSMEDGVIGYFDFINTTRYEKVKNVDDPKTYLENIKKAGYATSLKYVDNLMAIIEKYDLTKYDKKKEKEKYYRCQCGCYAVKANAEKTANMLKAHGLPVMIKAEKNRYYVQCGAFKIKDNAKKRAQTLKDLGFSVYIKYC